MNILLLMPGVFPYGSARASRVMNICRLIISNGDKVSVLAEYSNDDKGINETKEGLYENIPFKYVGKPRNLYEKFYKLPIQYYNLLVNYLDNNNVDLVLISSFYAGFPRIISELKKRDIPVILESGEWYHSSTWKYGMLNPQFYQFQISWYFYYKKVDGVIAISRLLEKYNTTFCENVLRIPSILDVKNTEFKSSTKNDKIHLMFAGSLARSKDNISNIITALSMLDSKLLKRFRFDIYGPSLKEVEKQLGEKQDLLNNLSENIHVFGKINQNEVHKKIMESDYTIFFRPDRRSSNAGFPTKLAESMVAGTPVICNDTGDIGLYLKHNENGYLVNDSPESIAEILTKIAELSHEEVFLMRKNTRLTAEKNFDYRNYRETMKKFIVDICNGKKS